MSKEGIDVIRQSKLPDVWAKNKQTYF
jgi:hypothetical protein